MRRQRPSYLPAQSGHGPWLGAGSRFDSDVKLVADWFSHVLLGRHEFSWAVMPHAGSFLESDVPIAAFIYNSPLHGQLGFYVVSSLISLMISSVRTVPGNHAGHVVPPLPFWFEGTPNIFLETIKRGEDDFKPNTSSTTVILRMYEAFGGHGSIKLHLGKHVPVKSAYVTNILEDTKGELGLMSTTGSHSTLKLEFRSFEVKTVKLVLETKSDISAISPKTWALFYINRVWRG